MDNANGQHRKARAAPLGADGKTVRQGELAEIPRTCILQKL